MERRVGSKGGVTFHVRHTPDQIQYFGRLDQCSSDCELIRRSKDGDEEVINLRASRGGKGRYWSFCFMGHKIFNH